MSSGFKTIVGVVALAGLLVLTVAILDADGQDSLTEPQSTNEGTRAGSDSSENLENAEIEEPDDPIRHEEASAPSEEPWWSDDQRSESYYAAFKANVPEAISIHSDQYNTSQLERLKEIESAMAADSEHYFNRVYWEELGDLEFHQQVQYVRLHVETIRPLSFEAYPNESRRMNKLARAPFQFTPDTALQTLAGVEVGLTPEQKEQVDLIYWRALGERARLAPDEYRFNFADRRGLKAANATGKSTYGWEFAPTELVQIRNSIRETKDRYLESLEAFIASEGLLQEER